MRSKTLAYTIQQETLKAFQLKLKRAHAYELIASYFSFNSQAAMDSAGIIITKYQTVDSLYDDDELSPEDSEVTPWGVGTDAFQLLTERFVQLGYETSLSQQFWKLIDELIEGNNLSFAYFEEVVWRIEENDDNFAELEDKANRNQPGALYAMACLRAVEAPEKKNGHWYRQRRKGASLSQLQTEFADEYEDQLKSYEKYLTWLRKAAESNHGEAAYELANQQCHDEQERCKWLQRSAKLGYGLAQSVLTFEYEQEEWLVPGAENGDFDCLDELARNAAETKGDIDAHIEAYMWVKLAELYGHNLTQSVADNDEDYGPVFVIYDGINLPALEETCKNKAHALALEIYERHS